MHLLCGVGPSGGEWTILADQVTDSCYAVKDLPRGASYVFRVGCITKSGSGPFSEASSPVVMATHPEGQRNTARVLRVSTFFD